ncbi:MAG: M48 family metallopeptidase [Opitutae bacterium]|nr:M48 family metallopeptidase [Opitutae bacterium]
MDFFEHQDKARKKTGLLVLYFALAVVCIFGALFLLASFIFSRDSITKTIIWDPALAGVIAFGTATIVGFGTLFKVISLAGGGKVVAEALGGKLLSHQTKDLPEKRFLNIVEEMALASGTPVPPSYIMEEKGINAFAAGYSPENAVIGVTRGCIEKLNREQLQGVVAHEFSHIFNGDMRLNIRLMGILHGILLLAGIGYYLMRVGSFSGSSRRNKDSGNIGMALLVGGLGMLVIGYIGAFFANLIKAAVSRQREFLADSSAVQFTRNPQGISGALKRIGGYSGGSKLKAPNAKECSHMFFGSGVSNLFATHPPLGERIRRIEPKWQGSYPETDSITETFDSDESAAISGFSESREASSRSPMPPPVQSAVTDIGNPSAEHVDHARGVITNIPEELLDRVHEPFGARAVIFSLLVETSDGPIRQKQVQYLYNETESGTAEETLKSSNCIANLTAEEKFCLVELASPALAHLSLVQFTNFQRGIEHLCYADDQLDLFEWSLQKLIDHDLGQHFLPQRQLHGKASIGLLANECKVILATLSHYGQNGADPEPAYNAGFSTLNLEQSFTLGKAMPSPEESGIEQLENSVVKLTNLAPQAKKTFLLACAKTIAHDQATTDIEAQILRGVAAVLNCPLPPII